MRDTEYRQTLTLKTKFNNLKQKTFEVSVIIVRGREQILIGVASLKFIGAVLETEVEIPIHLIGSTKAIRILSNAKTGGKFKFLRKANVKDCLSHLENPYSVNDGTKTVSFKGGDNKRKYALDKGAKITLKVSNFDDVFNELHCITISFWLTS